MSSFKEEFEEKKDALSKGFEEKKDAISKEIEETKESFNKEIKETKESINKTYESGVKKTKSFFRKAIIGSFILLILAGAGYLLWANYTYSEGTRTGYLMKISKKGYVFKTHEGQLNLGGFQESDNTSVVGNTWDFSLKDNNLATKLEQLQGKKVMLHYKEINKAMPWQGETNYYIYQIEEK